jgi:5-formyltetrahydrofolate cyclo-ligase
MKKAELRSLFTERRRELSPKDLSKQSLRIRDLFFNSFDLSGVHYLHSYLPIRKLNEVDTWPIIEQIWLDRPDIITVTPRYDFDSGRMDSFTFSSQSVLSENRWSIPEPAEGEAVDPKDLDLLLVPLLCCDARGHRIGYGKGIYDRFLSELKADSIKVGLNLFVPVDRIDDVGGHDIPLNYCLTPERLFKF